MSGEKDKQAAWGVFGQSVTGAIHRRKNLVNQDRIRWKPEAGSGMSIMMAIADGHGGDAHFRSDIGAQYAVDIAIKEMESLVCEIPFPIKNHQVIKHLLEQVPENIVNKWREQVSLHWKETGLTPKELEHTGHGH